MTYRLIVADLDGTLMGDDVTFSPAVLVAVHGVVERGLFFTIATGRTFAGALPFAQQLRVNAPVILFQGSEIRQVEEGRVLYQRAIPLDCARELLAWAKNVRLHANVYLDDRVYVAEETSELDFYLQLNQVTVYPVGDLPAFLEYPPTKILLIADPGRLDQIAPLLSDRFAGRMEIVRSHRRFLEAIPAGVNKGQGVAWLASYLGVSQAETVAIGDNDNDTEMVAWAGLGVAMGNSSPAVRAVADIIAPSVKDDGAAWAIQTYVLNQSGE